MASIVRFPSSVLASFSRIRLISFALALALLVVSAGARAAEPVFVWYRTSEGCPKASVFLATLTERAAGARLAEVGDRIDFVVTLGTSADGALGRLERQTERGTVAIRELRGPRCESVAEALALSLALAVDADAPSPPPAESPANPASQEDRPKHSAVGHSKRSDWASEGASPELEKAGPTRPWKIGLHSSGTTLAEGRPLLGGGAFLEWQRRAQPALGRRSLRFTAHGGIVSEAASNVRVWILAGRLDASPFALGTASLQLRPAAALDLGLITAENRAAPGQDRAFWLALSTLTRLAWQLQERWSLEAEAGLLFPMTRYELWGAAGQPRLSRVDAVGITAGVAATFELP